MDHRQRADPADHELGAEVGVADARDDHLRQRAGMGGVVGRTAGDRLLGLALLGAALIVAGVVVSERRPRRSNVQKR
ncbi:MULTISPECIES: hypothetical protein [Sphingomonas]|jgi:hypothetical protein|uniref:hypothetical protein n=1 Tax=Sphingomonas TaxID=13687 RepID=UPI0018D1FCAF|nr:MULTISPECIES: hypothetical protein [Sphingomonas]MBY0301113.1 hypothetical protein [Sphingomonas ginsenosidimutans]